MAPYHVLIRQMHELVESVILTAPAILGTLHPRWGLEVGGVVLSSFFPITCRTLNHLSELY